MRYYYIYTDYSGRRYISQSDNYRPHKDFISALDASNDGHNRYIEILMSCLKRTLSQNDLNKLYSGNDIECNDSMFKKER